jgi:histidinol-phosphatase (PHP family)
MMTDYHLHTQFSPDGADNLTAYVACSLAKGVTEFCVTDHIEFSPLEHTAGDFPLRAYRAAAEAARSGLLDKPVIRLGFELGEPHMDTKLVRRVIEEISPDFLLGSVHWAAGLPVGHQLFAVMPEPDAYREYFVEVRRMVDNAEFDVLGHLDLVKRDGYDVFGPFESSRYFDYIEPILKALISDGRGIEVNTSGYSKPCGEPHPGLPVLKRYFELGGRVVTIGSDSHRATNIANHFDRAVRLLRSAGFTEYTLFEQRKPRFVPLPEVEPADAGE